MSLTSSALGLRRWRSVAESERRPLQLADEREHSNKAGGQAYQLDHGANRGRRVLRHKNEVDGARKHPTAEDRSRTAVRPNPHATSACATAASAIDASSLANAILFVS